MAIALAVYTIQSVVASNNIYNHFVWQASAWLEGETSIAYPVTAVDGQPGNEYFNDVVDVLDADDAPTGRGVLPFPPLPALVLLPFVKLWGLVTDEQRISAILGAFDVGLAFWMLGRLGIRASVRIAVTVFFAFGTVFWYTSEKGSTWFFAHVVAVGLTLLAVGIALGADRAAVEDAVGGRVDRADEAPGRWWSPARWGWHGVGTLIDGRQFLAGSSSAWLRPPASRSSSAPRSWCSSAVAGAGCGGGSRRVSGRWSRSSGCSSTTSSRQATGSTRHTRSCINGKPASTRS